MENSSNESDKAAVSVLYAGGTLLDRISDHFVHDASDPFLTACVELHNAGAIDLLALTKGPKFEALTAHHFFQGQHFFCLAIPNLNATTDAMMNAVGALVAKGGDDLAANQPNAAFLEWCKVDLTRARKVVEAAKVGDALASTFVTFALTAGNMASEAKDFIQSYSDARRLSGVVALGRMTYSNPTEAEEAIKTLSLVLNDTSDDVLIANVMSSALDVAVKTGQIGSELMLSLVELACRQAGPQTLFCCARSIWRHGSSLSEDALTVLLLALGRLDASHKGTIREVDSALRKLLDTPHAVRALKFIGTLMASHTDTLALSEFDSFEHALATGPKERLDQALVDWLLEGAPGLCSGLSHLLRRNDRSETPFDLSSVVAPLDGVQQIFLCRKAIGYFFLQPVVAASILVSVLRVCEEEIAEVVGQHLFDPLLVNYGGTITRFLETIDAQDPAFAASRQALRLGDEYLDGLKSAGTIKELHPSEHELQLEHFRFSDETRKAHKEAMQQSVLLSLVHRSVILYGRRSLTYVASPSEGQRPVEMELKPFSVSMELPRMEVIDPFGLDYMLRRFRAERLATMKLIIRDYLGSLREREELDAILPDLLSELGFIVYSRPSRGTAQYGVDVAAVGLDDDGVRKVFLFSVKQGDLTRQHWDGTLQGLRASLNQIRDVYIPTRIPTRYKDLKVVVCLCFGGDIQEQVRAEVTGYVSANTTERVSFDEWNGDKIAGMLLKGILREEILPKPLRASFQKAVALVDQPDIAYLHFLDLTKHLRRLGGASQNARVRAARQLYVCLWILFVWARDVENAEAPYRASELVLLNVWDLFRPLIGKKNKNAKALNVVLQQLIQLHLVIAAEVLERKVIPHVGKRHSISMAVSTRNSVDVNLKLFEFLGRIAMTGLWIHWLTHRNGREVPASEAAQMNVWRAKGFQLIANNPALFSPLCDQHAVEIALFLMLAADDQSTYGDAANWLDQIVARLDFALRAHGRYACVFTDYRDLIVHPRERSDEYLRDATSGSVLIPLLAAWLAAFGRDAAIKTLVELKGSVLAHCTLQLWLPDASSEEKLYIGDVDHGVALTDIPLSISGRELLDTIADGCKRETSFEKLSANASGFWPIVLLACRHYRLPIPPHFWISLLHPDPEAKQAG